jgi:glycosyltransferase involved in cell wall biosynthesis
MSDDRRATDVLVDLTCLDTPSRFTGTGRYVHELGKALLALSERERQGLVISALVSPDREPLLGALDWPGSPEVRWDAAQEVGWQMSRRVRLPQTLRTIRPSLFHATYSSGTPRGSFVPRVTTCLDLIPLVLHRDYLPNRPVYRRLLAAANASRFWSARRVQAISQHTADDLMRLLGLPASRIDVVHLGVDLERYRPLGPDDRERAREVLELNGLRAGRYFFYMGAADPRKNVDVLSRAFAAARLDDFELVLIGKLRPSDKERYRVALDAAGHPPNVRFLDFVPEDELPIVVASARGFVFCSTYEGFGNVPVEAMACGCPVITTGLTSMRETVGDAALLVPPRDVGATASAIRRLALDDALWRELSAAGLSRARRFSWRNTALASVESYRLALAPTRTRALRTARA